MNRKMDSSPFSEMDDLTDLTRQHLNIQKEPVEKVSSITKLTAKYSKSRTSNNVSCSELTSNSNPGSTLKIGGLKNYSTKGSYSSDDDSSDEFQGSSLSALAAKHKKNVIADTKTFQTQEFSNPKREKSGGESSEDEFSSPLAALAAKHKVQAKLEPNSVCGQLVKNEVGSLKSECEENVDSSNRRREKEPNFRFANFTNVSDLDDSRSEEKPCNQNVDKEFVSSDNTNSPILKDILAVKQFHRQHSKSESDGFSINNQILSSKFHKSNIESETSTSLNSLKESTKSIENFEFSLGCSIPSSFKSKNAGKGLASSLSSVRNTSLTNLNNSFSDPDVSSNSKHNDGFSGINLFSALKSPSHTSIPADDNNVESEDEEIVTLLDTMDVDEEIENGSLSKNIVPFVVNQVDYCNFDTTHSLSDKLKLKTKKCSSFGKLVCKRWKPLKKPYIRSNSFITSVIPFKFATPSPDDIIAGFLERRQ